MKTTNKETFLSAIRQYKTGILETEKLKVEIIRLRCPITYVAFYYERKQDTWVKYSTYETDCSYDLAADISYEINLFTN